MDMRKREGIRKHTDIFLLSVFSVLGTAGVNGSDCGGYLLPTSSDSGQISSPNYPSNYGNNQNCVWLLEAPKNHHILLDISGIDGEADGASCVDFLQVRNGSSVQTVLYDECSSAVSLTAQDRWIWVRFTSNYDTVGTGFQASWRVVSGANTADKPFVDCPMEFRCKNKECIPDSYRCDGYSDCGCDGDDCDEHECEGLQFTVQEKIGIGVGVGVGFFIITFFGIGILDIYLKKRSERKYQERMELQKKLMKQKKASKMASLFVGSHSDSKRNSVAVSDSKRNSLAPTTSSVLIVKNEQNNTGKG